MTQGFVTLNPDVDATGKPLDNDVVQIPAGTVVSDQNGNLTTLAAPAYYFRERVTNSDPVDPKGIANVRNDQNGLANDYGLNVRSPIGGITDLQQLIWLLTDIDQNIATLAGTFPGGGYNQTQTPVAGYLHPATGIDQGVLSPTSPRRQVCDIFGRAVMVPHASREAIGSSSVTITSTTAAQTLVAALGNNVYADLVSVIAINTSATATELDLSDGTQTIPMYLPAGDMRGISLGGVLIKATNPNVAWTATTITSVASVKVWTNYVQNRTQ